MMKCLAVPTIRRNNLYFSITYLTLFLLITSTAFAGGSIFGGHKSRTSNPDGVSSIGVHICGSLNCPDVILKKGDCDDIKNASMKYGVCVCDDGYQVEGGRCKECPENQYSDGIHGCQPCPEDTYRDKENRKCLPCPEEPYCPTDNECCTLSGPEDECGYPTPVLGFKEESGFCRRCSFYSNSFLYANEEVAIKECSKCNYSSTPRWLWWYSNGSSSGFVCSPCSYFVSIPTTSEECSTCDNTETPRKLFEYKGKIYCGLAECPEERKLQDLQGYCLNCDIPTSWPTTAEACAKCDTLRVYNAETGECSLAS